MNRVADSCTSAPTCKLQLLAAHPVAIPSLSGCMAALLAVALVLAGGATGVIAEAAPAESLHITTFSVDVTCPLGHPLLAGLRSNAETIVDPLLARGIVLVGSGDPIVLCAVDWCEIRNQSYDLWRDALARAGNTNRRRVLLFSLHQHDAPVTDQGAAELLATTDLAGAMFDVDFENECVERAAGALAESLQRLRRVTHLGLGQAQVDQVASNRRVVAADGAVTYGRGSNAGGNRSFRDAPVGLVDPWLKTLSFWDEDEAVAALHVFATHPMSFYGQGGVSADFVGMARRWMQRDHPSVFQMYASGCSGDVTAGKYNDGSPDNRPVLAERLYQAMQQAWQATERHPLSQISFRSQPLALDFRPDDRFSGQSMRRVLGSEDAAAGDRLLAAMGLASRQRVAAGRPIDFPCIDFSHAQLVLFPGETWIAYQLMAQQQRPESMVVCIGYGECWPGYIPSTQGFSEQFDDSWYWVAPRSDQRMAEAIRAILSPAE